MRQSAVSFQVKGLEFEGIIVQPKGEQTGLPGVVICHPHPLHGGNMDNNVVLSVCFALAEQGFAALRFNFRGVGNSEGEHTKGESEHQEALGALDLMEAWPSVDGGRIGLAGYSFGTSVILGSPELQKRTKAIALISPSIRALENTALAGAKQPVLVITGDQDELVQSDQFGTVFDGFSSPPTCHIVAGADHYWYGYESQLAPRVVDFFSEKLK